MQLLKDKSIKDFILIHVIFAILAAITLLFPFPGVLVDLFPFPGVLVDGKLLILVILYNALIIVGFYTKGHEEWKSIWLFSFILSLFMVFPDWYLAETLGALVFPPGGLPMIGGSIPLYMAGLWSIPFFIILFIGKEIQKRKSLEMTYGIVSILAVLIFVSSEVTLVTIMPELFLGLTVFLCYEFVREKKIWVKIIGAFAVMIFYIGTASFFYFLIETLLL